ncbi:MAG: hypothetical protein DHS20C16_07410 [Phycisphaerae bacterium]|nr:MAG: hypothetical protein DHS20C16_07410 [Phycisphaerae bacterium]
MVTWFRQLDELLRGKRTEPGQLAEDRVNLPLGTFVSLAIILGALYGFFMGWYALFNHEPTDYRQLLATVIKLPALFLLTLIVTFPSLYVFNALVGCRMTMTSTLRLLVGAVVVNVTVAASLGPILGFFTLSTTSYPFMIVLNIILLAVAGFVALGFLLHTLRRVSIRRPIDWSEVPVAPPSEGDADAEAKRMPGPLESIDTDPSGLGPANGVFKIWVLLYGLVGAQMGWLLRPFIGSPDLPFEWFRERQGNFFMSAAEHLSNLLGGG